MMLQVKRGQLLGTLGIQAASNGRSGQRTAFNIGLGRCGRMSGSAGSAVGLTGCG